jgi:hypothetical protein
LHLYGQAADTAALDWEWAEQRLREAGTYWVTARTGGHLHPRPVWGVFVEGLLYLSIGTPATREALEADPTVTVHLDSGTEVVILEGRAIATSSGSEVVAEYDRKYDWSYDIETYGPFSCVAPETVLAWHATGWAGRESFRATGSWRFD